MTRPITAHTIAAIFLSTILFIPLAQSQPAAKPPRPAAAPVPITGQPPATILIIRHAEKLTDGQIDLSPTGFKRASLLPHLFVPAGPRSDLPVPQVIFATHLSAHSNRPVETVTPLARALHLPIDHSISNEDYSPSLEPSWAATTRGRSFSSPGTTAISLTSPVHSELSRLTRPGRMSNSIASGGSTM